MYLRHCFLPLSPAANRKRSLHLLTHNGLILEDKKRVRHYGLQNNDTLLLHRTIFWTMSGTQTSLKEFQFHSVWRPRILRFVLVLTS